MRAEDVMTKTPITVSPETGIIDVIKLIRKTRHDGFPVVENEKLVGVLTYDDIILQPLRKEVQDYTTQIVDALGKKVQDIMQRRVIAIPPDMEINAVARLIFRTGHSRFPVIDNEGRLLGLITNTDVIRAHIERVTPAKVEITRKTIEDLHHIKVHIIEQEVNIKELIPTQGTIYMDEVHAREYEIKRGLAEPLLVVKNGNRLILVDGHHRAVAAKNAGLEKMSSYLLVLEKEVELGMEKTAEKQGLKTLGDINVSDGLSPYALPIVVENGVVKRIV